MGRGNTHGGLFLFRPIGQGLEVNTDTSDGDADGGKPPPQASRHGGGERDFWASPCWQPCAYKTCP